jgi:hypothetical protein
MSKKVSLTMDNYKGHNCALYTFNDGCKIDNISYFTFALNDRYKEIMSTTGGFCANMTTRMIKEKNLDVDRITLMCIPSGSPEFRFFFAYLKEDVLVHAEFFNNRIYDYKYFYEKFKDCIIDEGKFYDICDESPYKDIQEVKDAKEVTDDFGILVNGEPFTIDKIDETIITDDLSIFTEEIKNSTVKYVSLSFDINAIGGVRFTYNLLDKDHNILTNKDIYAIMGNEIPKEDAEREFYKEPFEEWLSINSVKRFSNLEFVDNSLDYDYEAEK